jgi:hypothetical protein
MRRVQFALVGGLTALLTISGMMACGSSDKNNSSTGGAANAGGSAGAAGISSGGTKASGSGGTTGTTDAGGGTTAAGGTTTAAGGTTTAAGGTGAGTGGTTGTSDAGPDGGAYDWNAFCTDYYNKLVSVASSLSGVDGGTCVAPPSSWVADICLQIYPATCADSAPALLTCIVNGPTSDFDCSTGVAYYDDVTDNCGDLVQMFTTPSC